MNSNLKQRVFADLNVLLKATRQVIDEKMELEIDLDEAFFTLYKMHNIDHDYSIMSYLYSFLDILFDSYTHQFKEVNDGYTYAHAIRDLDYIIHCIENNNLEELEQNEQFLKRMEFK